VTGRHLLTRVVLTTLLAAVAASACGVRPSGVITGGPAPTKQVVDGPAPTWGATLYFVAGPALTPVVRPTRLRLSPAPVLALLQNGPDGAERTAGLTSEVPAELDPVSVTTGAAGSVEVLVSADVSTLSATAVDQIVCTVRDALPTAAPITVTGGAASRGPQACPLPG
jgi:hypothetical protein